MRELSLDVPESCRPCGRCFQAFKPFIPMHGEIPCDILMLGEAPGRSEDRIGLNFVGKAGVKLHEAEAATGLSPFKIAWTNSCLCWSPDPLDPRKNKTPTPEEIKACQPFLWENIKKAQAKVIVLLGAKALKAATGQVNITKTRGQVIHRNGLTFFPTYHPSYVLRDTRYEKTFLDDLTAINRMLEDMIGKTSICDRLRSRYRVIMTREELNEVLEEAGKQECLGVDTEFYPLDAIDVPRICYGVTLAWKRHGQPNAGIFIPIDHAQSPFLGDMGVKEGIAQLIRSKPLKAHNGEVDFETFHLCFGVHPSEIHCVADTMFQSVALHGPNTSHALKTLAFNHADTGGYDQELVKFCEDSLRHRKTLLRVAEIQKQLEHVKGKGKTSLQSELRTLADPFTEAIAFIKKHNGYLFDGEDWGTIPLDILANPYGSGDGDTCLQLDAEFSPEILRTGQQFYFEQVFNPSWRLNLELRRNGMLIDWDQWRWRWEHYRKEKERIYRDIRSNPSVAPFVEMVEAQKKDFSLRSGPQMRALLFTVLQLEPSGKRTEKGMAQLDEGAILLMAQLNKDHPHVGILSKIIEMGKIDKILGT